ncbi:hypothetical protein B0I35DRAFT_1517 [Stachybotrys elegans]|uniref:Uncharacterized protein n=1 Tax=Stachybotrys elegans TaxID=80388 RepID=A0A8K0T029_9HYPO|nr:hypothetical protein B0I35DRAFT_1517 [Stachybotrys elegans]
MPRQRAFFSVEAPPRRPEDKNFEDNNVALWAIAIFASALGSVWAVFAFYQSLLVPAASALFSASSGIAWCLSAAVIAIQPALFISIATVFLVCSVSQGFVVDRFLEGFALNWAMAIGNVAILPAFERLSPGNLALPTAALFSSRYPTSISTQHVPLLTCTASSRASSRLSRPLPSPTSPRRSLPSPLSASSARLPSAQPSSTATLSSPSGPWAEAHNPAFPQFSSFS